MTARQRHEIGGGHAAHTRFADPPHQIGNGHPPGSVNQRGTTPGEGDRLQHQADDLRLGKQQFEHGREFGFVDAGRHRHRQRGGDIVLLEQRQDPLFFRQQRPATERLIDFVGKPVELERDNHAAPFQFGQQPGLPQQFHSIGGDADPDDLRARQRQINQLKHLRMQQGFAARQIQDIDLRFRLQQPVEHPGEDRRFEIAMADQRGEAIAAGGIDADRAGKIAAAGDLDDRHAEMLFMPFTEAAAIRAAQRRIAGKGGRHRSRFDEAQRPGIIIRIAPHQRPVLAMRRAENAQPDAGGIRLHPRRHQRPANPANPVADPKCFRFNHNTLETANERE